MRRLSWASAVAEDFAIGVAICAAVTPAYAAGDLLLADYAGEYVCHQGATALRLRVFGSPDAATRTVVFQFGPTPANPVPAGSFSLIGVFEIQGGKIDVNPTSWIAQPAGFVMVGLHGWSSDGGATFQGSVSGPGCTTFSVHRILQTAIAKPAAPPQAPPAPLSNMTTRMPAPPPPPSPRQPSDTARSEIALHEDGGTLVVPVSINGVITLNFIVDSGAADVSIPVDVVMTLIRDGTLNDNDFLGSRTYQLADGSTVPSQTFRIRTLNVGGRELHNVVASIAKVEGSLLLGQSFLSRFKSWSIDNQRLVLVLE